MLMLMAMQSETVKFIRTSDFEARCLALLDEVGRTGETWVVTQDDRPVAELRPYRGARAASPFGLHPTLRIVGDVVTSMDDPWDAQA
jgi:antitoxin (DNA-binding transcriptional repressor) of toxin-antitoxin stability system